ncbi:MAG: 2-keto-4-pentenoate hydratase, partial [Halobaculum sp.]
MDIDRVADRLAASFRTGESAEPVSLSLADGYRVQEALVARLTETHGPVVGYKLGFTNRAVQREIGVDEPVYGRLLSETVGVERVQRAATVAPRAEPEIVVRVGEPLPADATRETVAERVAAVAPAVEIVDSRTAQWELAPGPAVADDALAARLAVGPERPLDA